MYTAKRIPLRIVARFAWQAVVFFFLYATAIYFLYTLAGWHFLGLPFVPIATIGTAVAFYVGFKNNASYERLWEGRRIWGGLVNASRSWGMLVADFIAVAPNAGTCSPLELYQIQQQLIYRHIAYVNALRLQLRSRWVWSNDRNIGAEIVGEQSAFEQNQLDKELSMFLDDDEVEYFIKRQNPAAQIIKQQSAQLRALRAADMLTDYYHCELERLLMEFYNQQGAAERIKSFPFPRQYAFFSQAFVWIFVILLPFGLLTELGKLGGEYIWLTIPFSVAISWVFYTMEVVGDTSENPFENSINDVPMTAICRTIEIDLREMLGEKNLPQRMQAVDNILM
ncbi:putative membrane protein [Larkinella arboricola]|uniref:Putative membrane protein n=1 Tax=Larkinella arboricola TaxID=643671 RepID=A0A327WN89_LARAB|nr:bestrophin family ion channel [Larkinella arboricola]RAJ93161.1 putative membrane protein [Larkinella arboricola]